MIAYLLSTNSDGMGYHIKHGYKNAGVCLNVNTTDISMWESPDVHLALNNISTKSQINTLILVTTI